MDTTAINYALYFIILILIVGSVGLFVNYNNSVSSENLKYTSLDLAGQASSIPNADKQRSLSLNPKKYSRSLMYKEDLFVGICMDVGCYDTDGTNATTSGMVYVKDKSSKTCKKVYDTCKVNNGDYYVEEKTCLQLPTASAFDFDKLYGVKSADTLCNGKCDNGACKVCDNKKWTYFKTDHPILGMFGFSSNDVYAVGLHGTILHYDGNSWQQMNVDWGEIDGSNKSVSSIWGSSPTNLFAVTGITKGSEGIILHYDGIIWKPIQLQENISFSRVFGFSDTDVYAIGGIFYSILKEPEGVVYHYDGISWNEMGNVEGNLKGIWGSSNNNLYFGNSMGGIFYYEGVSVKKLDLTNKNVIPYSINSLLSKGNIINVFGIDKNNIYITLYSGEIIHYDGKTFKLMDDMNSLPDNKELKYSQLSHSLLSMYGTSINNLYVIGWYGIKLYHYDGNDEQQWKFIETNIPLDKPVLWDIWVSKNDIVYLGGSWVSGWAPGEPYYEDYGGIIIIGSC